MKTECYLHMHEHPTLENLEAWARTRSLPSVGIDNVAGTVAHHEAELPAQCILLFGPEGPGLSERALAACSTLAITQYGSTRSINAGAASAIAMYAWCERHAR